MGGGEILPITSEEGEAAVLAVLLGAAGDPIAVSQALPLLKAAWDERATELAAADEPTFQSWIEAVEELGRYETVEIVRRVRVIADALTFRRRSMA